MKTWIIIFSLVILPQCWGAEDTLTKEALDKQFRDKVVAFFHSKEFSDVTAYDIHHKKLGELAWSVYGAHPDILKESAKKAFLALPTIDPKDIPAAKNPIALPIREIIEALKAISSEEVKTQLGPAVFLNYCDAKGASYIAMDQAISSEVQDGETKAKRAIIVARVRDIYRRANDDFLHPKIAVESLGEWFIIDLDWNEIGFYLPSRVEWRRDCQTNAPAKETSPHG